MLAPSQWLQLSFWESLEARWMQFWPHLLSGLVLMAVAWGLAVVARSALSGVGQQRGWDLSLTVLLARSAYISLLLFGVVTALGTVGIDVTALVAGLGLTGFALGFALKDIVSNTLAGILLIIYKPFRTGDTIMVTGLEGRVEEINLRYTQLLNEQTQIFIPNQTLLTNSVIVKARGSAGQTSETIAS